VRGWMRISVVLAAVLSVAAVPIGAAVFGGLNKGANVASILGFVIAALSFLYTTVVYRKSSVEAEKLKESDSAIRAQVVRAAGLPESQEQLESELLLELHEIEADSKALLGEQYSASVIRLIPRLLELGVWSESDAFDFDAALRTRNQVAHGDEESLSQTSVTEALETMRRLRRKLEGSADDD
jgi:hypothetical protein